MRRLVALSAGLLLVVAVSTPAVAADPPDVVWDAGIACEFALGFSSNDAAPSIYREFKDKEGNVAWALVAGRGGDSILMNMDTGATVSIRATGSVGKIVTRPDGSMTMEMMGGWILIMFPTDVPAGPSTTQVLGRAVMDIAPDGVTTLHNVSGRQMDICAALS